ncbi:hypothetical protein TSUD_12740 [Trifolium subterraneum]|uniref:Uncharacterized protein n=1 Tax=Trifolium subterraneum TaxID=3900 RepID=A0A2Z6PMB4_TRISU|nr:hypothetical protein TSUD_12740 [Trifolium subterraneum]
MKPYFDQGTKPIQAVSNFSDGNEVNIIAAPREISIFSSSLSDLFRRKLRLSTNNALYGRSLDTNASHFEEEGLVNSFEELEAQIISNLLPDEDDLLSGIPNVIRLTLGIIQVLLYVYYRRADRETDIEGAVVQEDMGGGGESLVGGAPVLELVEVGGRIVEVAEGGGTEVAEGREVEEAEGTPVVEKVIVEEENVSNPVVEKFNFRRIISSSAKRVRLSDGKKGNPVVEKVIIEEENVSNPVVDAKERRKFSRAKR